MWVQLAIEVVVMAILEGLRAKGWEKTGMVRGRAKGVGCLCVHIRLICLQS